MKKLCLLFALIVLSGISIYAQDTSIDSLYRTAEYKFPRIPPFASLFDSIASRSPQKLRLLQSKLDAMYNMGLVKKDWMNYISVSSSFNYGKGVGLGVAQTATGNVSSISNNTTSTYGGGIGMGFTLGAILNYGTKVKMAKIKVNQAQYELDVFLQEFRYKLFEQYTQLENDLEAFKATNLSIEMNNAQIIISEKQYRQGRIKLQELISARQSYDNAVVSFETLKRSCKLGIYYFEQLSGLDFQKYNNQIETK